ncbi:MAG: hypothetical protein AABW48_05370 [Nanoarchaeota archaeon]
MTIKPSELEQRAKEQENVDFKKRVTKLETEIDAHLLFFADRIKQSGRAEYSIRTKLPQYGAEVVPEAVVSEVVKIYKDAGWEVITREQYNQTILFFQRI